MGKPSIKLLIKKRENNQLPIEPPPIFLENLPPIWLVIPAAGSGSRMQVDQPKQYLQLCGKPIIENTLERFLELNFIQGIIVAISQGDQYWQENKISQNEKIRTVIGGKSRAESVLNALRDLYECSCKPESMWVLVHDAARPCVTKNKIIELVYSSIQSNVGGILASVVTDTLKRVNGDGSISHTEDRSALWQAHTPQFFKLEQLFQSLTECLKAGIVITDEASAIEAKGGEVKVVADRRDNIKVTLPEDLAWAEYILNQQECEV